MNLLSTSGTNALNNLLSTNTKDYYGNTQSFSSVISGISTPNNYTGANAGFYTSSIFSASSGISSSYSYGSNSYSSSYTSNNSTSAYNPTSYYLPALGQDGLNYNGAGPASNIPTSVAEYSQGAYGASLMGNLYTSIQDVALGQYAPTSVYEQRLNYQLGIQDQNKPGDGLNATYKYLGITSNNNATASSQLSSAISSSYNVFSTDNSTSSSSGTSVGASSTNGVSGLMSVINSMDIFKKTSKTNNTTTNTTSSSNNNKKSSNSKVSVFA